MLSLELLTSTGVGATDEGVDVTGVGVVTTGSCLGLATTSGALYLGNLDLNSS